MQEDLATPGEQPIWALIHKAEGLFISHTLEPLKSKIKSFFYNDGNPNSRLSSLGPGEEGHIFPFQSHWNLSPLPLYSLGPCRNHPLVCPDLSCSDLDHHLLGRCRLPIQEHQLSHQEEDPALDELRPNGERPAWAL